MAARKAKRERLNMRMPGDLLRWAKGYALTKNKTLTQLVVDHLTALKEQDHGNHQGVEARGRSATGVPPRSRESRASALT